MSTCIKVTENIDRCKSIVSISFMIWNDNDDNDGYGLLK